MFCSVFDTLRWLPVIDSVRVDLEHTPSESEIVRQFEELQRDIGQRFLDSEQRQLIRNKLDEIQQIVRQGIAADVDLVALKAGSIRCYFFCRSVEGLRRLHTARDNGVLKTVLQRIFRLLVDGESNVNVAQMAGVFSASELKRRLNEFRKDIGKPRRRTEARYLLGRSKHVPVLP
jgi:hypothetical protein